MPDELKMPAIRQTWLAGIHAETQGIEIAVQLAIVERLQVDHSLLRPIHDMTRQMKERR